MSATFYANLPKEIISQLLPSSSLGSILVSKIKAQFKLDRVEIERDLKYPTLIFYYPSTVDYPSVSSFSIRLPVPPDFRPLQPGNVINVRFMADFISATYYGKFLAGERHILSLFNKELERKQIEGARHVLVTPEGPKKVRYHFIIPSSGPLNLPSTVVMDDSIHGIPVTLVISLAKKSPERPPVKKSTKVHDVCLRILSERLKLPRTKNGKCRSRHQNAPKGVQYQVRNDNSRGKANQNLKSIGESESKT